MWIDYKINLKDLKSGMTEAKSDMRSTDNAAKTSATSVFNSFKQAGEGALDFGKKVVSGSDVARARLTLVESEVDKARKALQELQAKADKGVDVSGIPEARAKLTLLEKSAQDARAKLEQLQREESGVAKESTKAAASVQDLSNEIRQASSALSGQLKGALSSAGSGFLDFASKATIATAGILTLIKEAARLTGAIFAPNAALEQMTVSFDAFIDGEEQLASTMADIKKFAKDTPFETPEINKAALSLLNMDVAAEDLTDQLGDIGAAVSKVGGSGEVFKDVTAIIAQMGVEGKITTGEMMQLQERNIPAFKILAKEMGVSVRQLKDMISSNDELIMGTDKVNMFMDALGRFGGDAMIDQSKTWNGMMSTIKDTVKDVWVEFTGPSFEKAKGGLSLFMGILSDNQDAIMLFASGAGAKLAVVFDKAGTGLEKLRPLFDDLKVAVTDEPMGVFLATAKDLGGALLDLGGAALDLWRNISPFGSLFKDTGEDSNIFADILYTAGSIMQDHVTPAIRDFTALLRDMKPVVEPVGKMIGEIFQNFLSWIQENGPTLKEIAGDIFEGIGKVVEKVAPVLSERLLPALERFQEKVLPIITDVLKWIDESDILEHSLSFLGETISGMVGGISTAIDIITFVIDVFRWWQDAPRNVQKSIQDLNKTMQDVFGNIGGFFTEKLGGAKNAVEDAGKFVSDKWNEGVQGIENASKWLYEHNTHFKNYTDWTKKATEDTTKWINQAWTDSGNWVNDRWKWLSGESEKRHGEISKSVGDNLAVAGGKWNEFWGGVGANIGNAWSTHVSGPLGRFWGQVLGIWEGWKKDAWNLGKGIIDSIVGGLSAFGGSIRDTLANIGRNVLSGMSFHGFAGIPGHASGGRNLPEGWKLVGEEGPELAYMPQGSDIFSNRETKAMFGGGGSSPFASIPPAMLAVLASMQAPAQASGGGTIVIHNYIMLDERQIGYSVERYQMATLRSQGGVRR